MKKGHIQIKKVHQYVYHETEELIQKKKVHQIVIFPDDSASFPGRDECYQCPQVTYSPNAGSLCLNYPAGTTSNKSETSCHECSIGRYVDKGIWKICDNGKYASPDGTQCFSYPAGTYTTNSINFFDCPAGFYSGMASAKCYQCSYGYFSAPKSEKCTMFPAGTFSGYGASGCTKCKFGTFAKRGYYSCFKYDKGYYSPSGSNKCFECPKNTYAPEKQSSHCKKDPSGSKPGSANCPKPKQ